MPKSKTLLSICFFPLTLTLTFLVSSLSATALKQPSFHRSVSPASIGLHREKLSHLHFFLHFTSNGSLTVAEKIVTMSNTSLSGALDIAFDFPLTVGVDPTSKLVGRAVGIYAIATSLEEMGVLTALNLEFTEGEFNGSTLSLLRGQTVFFSAPAAAKVKEIPVVGGSKALRFARGYAQANSLLDVDANDISVEEYNVYVFHY